jgi:gamma-glutamyltranspeptidase/glutathione hydrolase
MATIATEAAGLVCLETHAAAAGRRILERGGNAVDAAIAASFVQGVVNPMMCGLGGTARLLLFLERSKEYLLLNAIGGAGARSRPDTFEYTGETSRAGRWHVKDHANYIGHQASVIPTFVRVVGEAHCLFGRLPWPDLIEPAISLAEGGFAVSPWLAGRWDPHSHGATDWPRGIETLNGTAECARIYLKDGRFYQAGETLVQADLGRSLRRIAEGGPDLFYEGEIGDEIARDFAEHDGLITREDLLRCRPYVVQPLEGSYRDHGLHVGGPVKLQPYNILEGFDLRALGHNSPKYLDLLARAFQISYLDRARYIADPRFADVPVNLLKSKQHAAGLRYQIESGEDVRWVEPGFVPTFGTTALVAMDDEGNAVAMMHSNGNSSGVVTPGLGFLYNNHMHNFNPRPGFRNSVAAGKLPEASEGPILVSRDGRPCLAISHYSRAGTTAETQVFLNVVEFGMSVQEAVEQPRIHAEYVRRTVLVDPDFPSELIAGLEALGTQKVVVRPISPAVSAVLRDPSTGQVRCGIDPRGERGTAVAP